MRIALITDGIAPYVVGGMQKHSFYLAKYFAKNKIFVDLVHYNNSELDINTLDCFTDNEKLYINSIILKFPSSVKFPGHYIYSSYKYSVLAFNAIMPQLKSYDFIYTKGFSGWKLIVEKFSGKIACCSIGINFHGYEMFQVAPNFKSKLQQHIMKPFVKALSLKADKVFSYGGKITEIIKSIGVPESKIIEIPSGVEKEKINSRINIAQADEIRFIFIGRDERRKGVFELNEVLRQLIKANVSFKFHFIGPIPDNRKIIHPAITYYGEIRDPKIIKDLLSHSDVLVCPSWSEGFPNVILEGMASGLAIIATNVGAVSELVSDSNGWLIECPQLDVLEKAMRNAIESTNLQQKKEESIKLVNTTFNWDAIFEKMIWHLQ